MSIDYLDGLLQEVSNEMLQEASHEDLFEVEGGCRFSWICICGSPRGPGGC